MPTPIFYQVQLTGGKFQDSSGAPLNSGWLEWRLNHDSNIGVLGGPTGTQVISGIAVNVYLDVNGNALPGQNLWPNDQLSPSGSYYTVRLFNDQGLEVWRVPQIFVLQGYPAGQEVDLGVLTPVQP